MPEKKKVEVKKVEPKKKVEAKKAEPASEVPAKVEGPVYSRWQIRHMARRR
jgi:hypothetical protein